MSRDIIKPRDRKPPIRHKWPQHHFMAATQTQFQQMMINNDNGHGLTMHNNTNTIHSHTNTNAFSCNKYVVVTENILEFDIFPSGHGAIAKNDDLRHVPHTVTQIPIHFHATNTSL